MNTKTILQNLINSVFSTNGTKGITGLSTRTTLNTLLTSSYLSAGFTMEWYGLESTIPEGWHKMDGTTYPIPTDENSTYYDLFNALGGYQSPYLMSPSDFHIPNVPQGHSTVQCGADYTLGSTGGEEENILTMNNLPTDGVGNGLRVSSDENNMIVNGTVPKPTTFNGKVAEVNQIGNISAKTDNLGLGLGHNNMPPYICVNKIIKLY